MPTILVAGGIAFLLLAVVGEFAEKFKLSPTRQKVAGIIGALLLFSGIVLYGAPGLPQGPTPTSIPTQSVRPSTFYDDFNDLTSDEGFDQSRWEVFKYFGCDVRQKDGVAVFSTRSFDRHLLGYWTAQSQATYYADDVRLTKR